MNKIDYKKVYREAYTASADTPTLVHVPPMRFLMVDGHGDPEGSARFQGAVEALFSLAYALKFALKKGPIGLDFAVMPLEGLWWTEKMARFRKNRAAWKWTLMIMQPPVIDLAQVELARKELARKKPLPALGDIRFESFNEGRAVQLLHVGPFSEEGATVERLHRFAADQGLALTGKHHEVYLSDLRRGTPERWKTILRQPVEGTRP